MTGQDSGIVVKAGRGHAVVLTRDGRFLRVRSHGIPPLVGEEIPLPSTFVPWTSWTRWVPAAALACIIVFISVFGYAKYIEARPALAYVSVDSTGSVELEVNDSGLVRSATAFDEDGRKLLSQVNYKFRPVETVIAEMAKIESKKGSSGFIVGYTPIKETPQAAKVESRIREQVRKISADFPLPRAQEGSSGDSEPGTTNPMVNMFKFTVETRDKARSMSVSPGRLAVWGLSLKSKGGRSSQTGSNQTGPGQGGEQEGRVSEDKVRNSLPDVSDANDFAKTVKEHNDPKELENVLDEMMNVFRKGKEKGKGANPGDGGAGTGGNGPSRGDEGKGGAGEGNQGKKGAGAESGANEGKQIDNEGYKGTGRDTQTARTQEKRRQGAGH